METTILKSKERVKKVLESFCWWKVFFFFSLQTPLSYTYLLLTFRKILLSLKDLERCLSSEFSLMNGNWNWFILQDSLYSTFLRKNKKNILQLFPFVVVVSVTVKRRFLWCWGNTQFLLLYRVFQIYLPFYSSCFQIMSYLASNYCKNLNTFIA